MGKPPVGRAKKICGKDNVNVVLREVGCEMETG
jgi:hypothetical protein